MITDATPVTPGRRRNMQAIRRSETRPELMLRSALHRAGYRFRKDFRLDVGNRRLRPDIVFTRHRLAIFVDGCFWHSCPKHGHTPSANQGYWIPKLQRTRERDAATDAALHGARWQVLRVWEHDIHDDLPGVVAKIARLAR